MGGRRRRVQPLRPRPRPVPGRQARASVRRAAPGRGRDRAARRTPPRRWACAAGRPRSAAARACPRRAARARRPRRRTAMKPRLALSPARSLSISRDSTTSAAPTKQALRPTDPAHRDHGVDVVARAIACVPSSTPSSYGCGTARVDGVLGSSGHRRRRGHPLASGRPPRTVIVARETRSRPSRPGQPCTARRQRHGTALAPQRAPSSAPAMAATVSVSLPMRTAACSASCRCRQGKLARLGS